MTNGEIVWSSGMEVANKYPVVPELAFEPCMVTVRRGSVQFDEGSAPWLTALTRGAPAGALTSAGEDRALLLVYDEEDSPVTDDTTNLRSQLAWQWWEVDFNEMTAKLIPGQEHVLGATISYEVDQST